MGKILSLLLAAGASRRMGTVKQLLPWGDQTVIEHQIDTLTKANKELYVILGANAKPIAERIANTGVHVLVNPKWKEGMGSSISFALNQLRMQIENVDGILISLVDQPLITASHYRRMIDLFEPGKAQIMVSKSEGVYSGVPVLFDRKYLDELMALEGEKGARRLINKHEGHVCSMVCNTSLEDMDTMEAYQKLVVQARFKH
jgi:molybdenum cofactor cytidylyltransferase